MSDPVTTSELPQKLRQELETVMKCVVNNEPLDSQAWLRLQAFRSAALDLPNRDNENGLSHESVAVLACYHAMSACQGDPVKSRTQFTTPNPLDLIELINELLGEQYFPTTIMLLHACTAMLEYSMGNGNRADNKAHQAYVIALDINNVALGSTWLLRGEIGQARDRAYALRQAIRCLRSSSDPLAIVSELRARHHLARRSPVAAWWHHRRIAGLNQQLRDRHIGDELRNRMVEARVIPTFMAYDI